MQPGKDVNRLQFFCSRFVVICLTTNESVRNALLQFFCSRFNIFLFHVCVVIMFLISFNSSVLDSIWYLPVSCVRGNYVFDKLQFFCSRFNIFLFHVCVVIMFLISFNSSVLDSNSWFYLLLFKFFPALSMVFVRGFILLVDARLVKSLAIWRLRCTKSSDEQFNSSTPWRL